MRICSECEKMMNEGYMVGQGDGYYCSEECLYKVYTEEEYKEALEDDDIDFMNGIVNLTTVIFY